MILRLFTYSMVWKPLRAALCKVSINSCCSCGFSNFPIIFRKKLYPTSPREYSHVAPKNDEGKISIGNRFIKDVAGGKYRDYGNKTAKTYLISKMNFRLTEHALAFHKLPMKTLLHIYKVTQNDEKQGYCKNRLYYLSDKLKCPPSLLSKYVAPKSFVYSLSFDWLEKSLNVLLEMGVSSDRIIRDLWVLKYNSETIKARLERVKAMGMEKVYPWMVRCSEDILKRYVTISRETKNILGDDKSTHIYLAKRLNKTLEDVEEMCNKTPALRTIRVTKVKHFLDFLISEGITTEDIATVPRILSASQKTVKERIDKLRQLGFQEINLNVICRSRKHFKKFCDSFEAPSRKNFS